MLEEENEGRRTMEQKMNDYASEDAELEKRR
jgi:hypothetical protein